MKLFVDGQEGTTGLRIMERLSGRSEFQIIHIDEAVRKDPAARKKCLNEADVAILCLPDDAARESVALIDNPNTRVLDTSTAHRTAEGWVYGFPELSDEIRAGIAAGRRVAVPGCHASGFIALVYPLVQGGLLSKDSLLACHSITGYSGGGKKMIAQYQAQEREAALDSPRQYGLTQQHKHLKEMAKLTGLTEPPVFCPIVSDFYSGMVMTVPIFRSMTGKSLAELREHYERWYKNSAFIKVYSQAETDALGGFLPANTLSGRDNMEIMVTGNEERMLLCARYDNLGKGASGAAIQCMNIMLGLPETAGLNL